MNPPTYRPEWIDTMPTHRIPHCPPCAGDCHQGRSCPASFDEPVHRTSAGALLLMAALIVAALALIAVVVFAALAPVVMR